MTSNEQKLTDVLLKCDSSDSRGLYILSYG